MPQSSPGRRGRGDWGAPGVARLVSILIQALLAVTAVLWLGLAPPPAQAAVTQCGAGTYGTAGSCSTCPAGSYCPVASSAPTACPAGDYCIAGVASGTLCPTGNYCPGASASYTPCPAGNYCAAGAATATAGLHLAHKPDKHADDQQHRQPADQQTDQ